MNFLQWLKDRAGVPDPANIDTRPKSTYELLDDGRAIFCLWCGKLSRNPSDVRERYCGICRTFHVRKKL